MLACSSRIAWGDSYTVLACSWQHPSHAVLDTRRQTVATTERYHRFGVPVLPTSPHGRRPRRVVIVGW